MADIVSRPAYAPRVPWRAITVAFLIGALLLAATVAYFGSRQPRVPLPFGLADNGRIVYASEGDIWTTNPVTGDATAIVTGEDVESSPMFSPDGTRLAFAREVSIDGGDGLAIVVTNADGSDPIEIARGPGAEPFVGLEWAPDSASLVAVRTNSNEIVVLDAAELAEPRVVATDADFYPRPYQPPDGGAMLIQRAIDGKSTMIRLDLATGDETVIASIGHGDLSDARWSPDGSRIAFLPYERVATEPQETWDVRPLRIYSVADDSIVDVGSLLPRDVRAANPAPGNQVASAGEGWSFEWAPDGLSLVAFPSEGTGYAVVIDAVTGEATTIDAVVTPISANQVWQRIAR